MRILLRFRHIFIALGSLVVLAALFLTDPDQGVSTFMILLSLVTPILALAFAHLARKALFDYPEADMRTLLKKCLESPTGAGLAFLGLCLVLYGTLGLFGKSVSAAELPPNAVIYAPMLKVEQQRLWSTHPLPSLLAGLVEQESCLSLRHSRCWSPTSKLKNSREEGAGLGQITRAYRADGTERFDSLSDMRRQYPELSEWSWANVYDRPDLQLRAIVLMNRKNYQDLSTIQNVIERLAFADAGYNGGPRGVQNDRRACQITTGCDPQKWFGHVEHTCTKSKTAIYGKRSACDINREHVQMVFVRASKYRRAMA
jgi:hypothetical protein